MGMGFSSDDVDLKSSIFPKVYTKSIYIATIPTEYYKVGVAVNCSEREMFLHICKDKEINPFYGENLGIHTTSVLEINYYDECGLDVAIKEVVEKLASSGVYTMGYVPTTTRYSARLFATVPYGSAIVDYAGSIESVLGISRSHLHISEEALHNTMVYLNIRPLVLAAFRRYNDSIA